MERHELYYDSISLISNSIESSKLGLASTGSDICQQILLSSEIFIQATIINFVVVYIRVKGLLLEHFIT